MEDKGEEGEEGEASILLGTGEDEDDEEQETGGTTSMSMDAATLASPDVDDACGELYRDLLAVAGDGLLGADRCGADEAGSTGRGDGVGREVDEGDSQLPPVPDASAASTIAGIALRNGQGNVTAPTYMSDKVARCKLCGVVISRDMLAIEVSFPRQPFCTHLLTFAFQTCRYIPPNPPNPHRRSRRRIWIFAVRRRPTALGVEPWAL